MPSINSKSLKTNKLPLQRIAKIDNDDSTGRDTIHNNTDNTHNNDDGNNKNDMDFIGRKKQNIIVGTDLGRNDLEPQNKSFNNSCFLFF